MKIEDIPDFASVRQIQQALWHVGAVRGAAIMVGAGYSRLSRKLSPHAPSPPLWSDFEREMAEALYKDGFAPSDPLRLAQEYEAALGASALDGLIRSMVVDNQWEPAQAHERLMALPWTDILTTNWDTLLERTPIHQPDRQPDIVRTISDIARAQSPRIIKLHGSLPSNQPFVFTEEHYRTYPATHAPFVNLAQQILLENELCLIGFSGDDPNFLQWSGWVRDHLGKTARPIRLVGVLNLSSSKRKMLEQRNVTPIDLAPLVSSEAKEDQHRLALMAFFDALADAKPEPLHKWNTRGSLRVPSSAEGAEKPTLADYRAAWASDRECYPGWLLAPYYVQVRTEHDSTEPGMEGLRHADIADVRDRLDYAYELIWRHDCSLHPIHKTLRDIIRRDLEAAAPANFNTKQMTFLSGVLAQEARLDLDKEEMGYWLGLLEAQSGTTAENLVCFNRAMMALSELDYEAARRHAEQVQTEDPVWKLRAGMVFAACLDEPAAKKLIQSSFLQLRGSRRKDPRSIWLLSREAWAAYLLSVTHRFEDAVKMAGFDFENWPLEYRAGRSDPWEFFNQFDRELAGEHRKTLREDKKQLFDPGRVRIAGSRAPGLPSASTFEVERLLRLRERIGLPPRIRSTDLLTSRFFEASECVPQPDDRLKQLSVDWIDHYDRDTIELLFNRIEVARCSVDACIVLCGQLQGAVEYFLDPVRIKSDPTLIISKVRVLLELLSRLAVRLSSDQAEALFEWACCLAKREQIKHWWLFRQLEALLERSFCSINPSERAGFAFNMIDLPLPGEAAANSMEHDWPELSQLFSGLDIVRPEGALKWKARIEELINAVRVGAPLNRTRAILRLLPLIDSECLEETEYADFLAAVWRGDDVNTGWPEDQSLLRFVYHPLQTREGAGFNDRYLEEVINPILAGEFNAEMLTDFRGLLQSRYKIKSLESVQTRIELTTVLINWSQAELSRSKVFPEHRSFEQQQISILIGDILANQLLPGFRPQQADLLPLTLLENHMSDGTRPHLHAAFSEYVRLAGEARKDVVVAFRKAILSRDSATKLAACHGIKKLIALRSAKKSQLMRLIISDLVAACELDVDVTVRFALEAATEGVAQGLFSDTDLARLLTTLRLLEEEYDLIDWDIRDRRTSCMSLVKAEIFRLANALLVSGQDDEFLQNLVETYRYDPMPEVRFALGEARHL